jgi:hypothetical protein
MHKIWNWQFYCSYFDYILSQFAKLQNHTHTHTHLHQQFMTSHGCWRIIQSYSHFIFKNWVWFLNCKEDLFTKFVGIPMSKTRCREMQVFFQSVEGLSTKCQNVTTPSSIVISGVMTLTNLLNIHLITQPVLLYLTAFPLGDQRK